MPLRVNSIVGACVEQGWRPRAEDPASKALAASLMAPLIVAWLDRDREGDPDPAEEGQARDLAIRMLVETADVDEDGYRLAVRLEKAYGISPDAELVDILSKWNETLDSATSQLEKHKVAELGIEPPFGFAAKAVRIDEEGNRIEGIAFRLADANDGRVAFVADEEPINEGPDLAVFAAELENIEVTGPAPERAVSLHPHVMAAVASYEPAITMMSLEKYAETDRAVFDVELEKLVEEQVDAGGELLAIHLEMTERFCRAFEDAVDASRVDEAWVAGMMAAAAMRRTTLRIGVPPEDADKVREMMTKVCEYLEGPGRRDVKPVAATQKRLH